MVGVDSNLGSDRYYANFNIKIGSLNMQGQSRRDNVKLRKVKNIITRENFDILLIQETRSDGSEAERRRWYKEFNTSQIYLTNLGSTSVGAGIIVKNEEVFKVHQSFLDPRGRYAAIIGDHEDGRFLVVSFYAPYIEKEIKEFVFALNPLCWEH